MPPANAGAAFAQLHSAIGASADEVLIPTSTAWRCALSCRMALRWWEKALSTRGKAVDAATPSQRSGAFIYFPKS